MKIAIVGTGSAGLTAAHYLHPEHDISVFEKAPHLGGHANTIAVCERGRERLAFLRAHGIDLEGGKVFVLTQCRVFGYISNPVSFYYCHDANAGLRCIVAEVNNTFGERHVYLLSERNRLPHSTTAGRISYAARKVMHVSPFVSMQAMYEFHFAPIDQRLSVVMKEYENSVYFFDAHLWGNRGELTSAHLAWLLVRYPLLTLKIMAAIHWQALWLYVKGAPFHRQPPPSSAQRAQARLWHELGKEYAG